MQLQAKKYMLVKYYLARFIFFRQNICSPNTIIYIIVIRKRAAEDGTTALKCVKCIC